MTHETTLPYLGFSLPWKQIPLKEHLGDMFTHALYGIGVELVRRLIRNRVFRPAPSELMP
jgi:uncharacterized membrane protein YagU involved in acid resistance